MTVTIHTGDVLDGLAKIESGTVQTCVTSPPYWGLRDYGTATWEGGDAACDHKIPSSTLGGGSNKGHGGSFTANYTSSCGKCGAVRVDSQIGLESSPDEYVAKMVAVFREVRRCLRDDGTLWLNLGDSYAANGISGLAIKGDTSTLVGSANVAHTAQKKTVPDGLKPKDLCMIPWHVALALQADGWWLRSVIVWAKKSPMPESVTDRPTSSWEPIFLLAKSERYFYDAEAVKEKTERIGGPPRQFGASNQVGTMRQDEGMTFVDNGTRNQRNVWHLGPEPFPGCHFATFPTEIPRRCIMAGTSEKGQCPACGAGWVRVVERSSMVIAPSGRDGRISGNGQRSTSGAMVEPPRSMTTGWEPSCSCNAGDPVPQIVLEPFLGSGTTLAVASQLGRSGVGCELNPEYVKLAQDRIGRATRPNTYQSEKAVDAPLFGATNA